MTTKNTHIEHQHGVMMNMEGFGILIIGQAGIGKSSFALELLYQGHQLIADDVVICQQINQHIQTTCPPMLTGFLHTRELGLIDVTQQFNESTILKNYQLDYVVKLINEKKPHISHFETSSLVYPICKISFPLLQLNIYNPASCYHRLLSWLSQQKQNSPASTFQKRQGIAMQNPP